MKTITRNEVENEAMFFAENKPRPTIYVEGFMKCYERFIEPHNQVNEVENSETLSINNDALLARAKDIEGRELLKAFLEHIESTIDFLPCEPNELIDDYYKSL